MERWSGLLRVPLHADSRAFYQVAASLSLSPSSNSPIMPLSTNAIFFSGDRVMGIENPVIERFSNLQNIADIMVSKIGGSVNAWVIEASLFNGPFAVYNDFIPSVNQRGEPKSYDPTGFPASRSTVSLLSNCLQEAKSAMAHKHKDPSLASISGLQFCRPKTLIFGFSKGGTVVNQLVTELGFAKSRSCQDRTQTEDEIQQIIPYMKEDFLDSIAEIHYVDVGLNSVGAYITDGYLVEKLSRHLEQVQGDKGIRFVLHGTPRQWCDTNRSWIRNEKDTLFHLLQSVTQRSGGKLQVCERFYFADRQPDLQMHFEIIEKLDVS
ncbi:uncharacterized protein LOC133777556 isoform X2 [Humulus lupulus]|uniref:uncharacterized protein LOC133777556 isoform X2 n=1 Tax=Humulus lupulus TaxID=3486 RepID=UPI002B417178|nr:uncharacterized protein LOC133777556 isoform X2 [Humulus lupulus]